MTIKTTFVACLLALVNSAYAAPPTTAYSFVDSLYQDLSKRHAISYYDVLLGEQYHMYFSVVGNDVNDYREWTEERVRRELLPILDQRACRSKSRARPGDTPDWEEFRKGGGALVVHLAHLSDPKFRVDVDVPAKSLNCPSRRSAR